MIPLNSSSYVSSQRFSPPSSRVSTPAHPHTPRIASLPQSNLYPIRHPSIPSSSSSCSPRPRHPFISCIASRFRTNRTPLHSAFRYTPPPRDSHPLRSFPSLQAATEVMGAPFPSIEDLEAVLFDLDGTLCDSDPFHFISFREMLQEVGFQGGVPINEDFFIEHISGKHNLDIGMSLFPDWDQARRDKFLDEKEARFRRLAAERLEAVEGLYDLCKWIEKRGLRRAVVTNAPRANAELMISTLGLTKFFELLIVGSECERAKPFPDPYQKALKSLRVASNRAFALEDSAAGLKAAVAAGLAVVGVTTRNPGDILLKAGASLIAKDFKDPNLWHILEGRPQKIVDNAVQQMPKPFCNKAV